MRKHSFFTIGLTLLILTLSACGKNPAVVRDTEAEVTEIREAAAPEQEADTEEETEAPAFPETEKPAESEPVKDSEPEEYDYPSFNGEPSVQINGNKPLFTEDQMVPESFEEYSDLDDLGRCGAAFACVGQDLMPTEERGSIGEVHPSGWQVAKYDGIEGNYLYNRCHLIAYSLTAENANEKNLITGTSYMNREGMNPYEILVANYVRDTGNHVLYRVTPIFEEDNLIASGVTMEAQSIEDDEICFYVYCFNVQPGITIDYATGDTSGPEYTGQSEETKSETEEVVIPEGTTYVLNTNTQKFHYPECDSVR